MNTKDFENYQMIATLFAEAEPEIPQSINTDSIKNKILLQQRHRRIKFKQKRNIKPLIAAAACFALILGTLSFFYPLSNNADKAKTFKTEQELNSFVSELESASSSELGAGSAFFPMNISTASDLNNRGSRIAANDNYIFYAYHDYNSDVNKNRIYIFNAGSKNPQLINIFNSFTDDRNEISSIAVYKNNLAVTVKNDFQTSSSTNTIIYDISNPKSPVLKAEFEQSGQVPSTYLINNTLYTATYYGTTNDNKEGYLPKFDKFFVKPENIYRFDNTEYIEYIVISKINLETGKCAKDTKAILGAYYEKVFIDECLYLTDGDYDNPQYIKYDLKSGKAENTTLELFKTKEYNTDDTPHLIKTDKNRLLSIAAIENGTEITLYDITNSTDPTVIDSKVLNGFYCNYNYALSSNSENYFFPYYKADEERRYYGIIELTAENDKITSHEHIAESDSIMYPDSCITVNDYIYSLYALNENSAEIYSFKYK